MVQPKIGRKDLTDPQQNNIAQWLLQRNTDGKLHYGAKKAVAEEIHLSLKTIWTIWRRAAAQQAQRLPIHIRNLKVKAVHKKTKEFDAVKVKNLSVLLRSSLRLMATNLGVSKSLCHNWYKGNKLKAHTNAIKPFLTPENKLARLNWSLSQLGCIIEGGKVKFQKMHNTIHVDEKWFYLTREKEMYYLAADEIEPHRTCKSKRYIHKIMFSCAVSRPIIDADGNVIFDGKFGIFPFITEEPAKRSSKNKEKGTMETKAVNGVTRPVMKQQLLNQMLPTIKAKWPDCLSKHIFIQQDNAKPHILDSDPEFQAVARSDGFHIQLIQQPPNSPDTNVNDLGFFRSIQSLKDQKPASNIDEMLHNVYEAFENYPPEKLNNIFLTLQSCYGEIMKVQGGNNYTIPHNGKGSLLREGVLPECFEVDEQVVRDNLDYLNMHGNVEDIFYNLDDITQSLEHVDLED